MRRTDRLFEIIQMFRGGRLILGRDIAERLEVSLRTIYRDIETLVASGVPIEGERGVGYILREPIFLPPLTLTTTELEALHLGMEVVLNVPDAELATGARQLLDKINAVLPGQLQNRSHLQNLSVYTNEVKAPLEHLATLRQAIRQKHILDISYQALSGQKTQRQIRPLNVEYWGHVWTCTAWCEKRSDFRAFRIDRILAAEQTGRAFQAEAGRTYADYLDALVNS
ncbi:transcriptional regulator [Rhodobacterales bacterium 52_120_T64]|nr:transcriptional regulator [Rhodobacterales bacterium 52_120_T64]